MRVRAPDGPSGQKVTADCNRFAVTIIAGFLAARLLFAYGLGLGVDESYTVAISRDLNLSYFDHPPLHQWVTHWTALMFGEGASARFPFILLFAATGWIVYRLTLETFGARAGVIALFALNATPFFFASAGTWIVPDGPLLFGLAAAAWALARLFFAERPDRSMVWRLWFAAGAAFGVAGLSKYSAALAAAGLAAFLLLSPERRRWFAHPAPYAAASLALAMTTPVFVWNATHGWASFAFQGGRGSPGPGLKPVQFLAMALGEIAYLSPWIFVPLAAGLWSAWREREDERRFYFLCLALPPIVVFTVTPLWGARGYPHWTMPGWFFAYPLMGAWVAKRTTSATTLKRWALASSSLLAAIAIVVIVQAETGWPLRAFPLRQDEDPTLEAFNWRDLRTARALTPLPAVVLSTRWSDAGKIALALGPDVPVYTLSKDPRGWAFVGNDAQVLGRDGVLVVRMADAALARASAGAVFTSVGPTEFFTLTRNGAPAVELALIPGKGLTARLPIPYPGAPGR